MNKWSRVLFQPSIPMGKDGKRATNSVEHISLSKEAAKEGMVLLKNDQGVLPLKRGAKVALFGKGTFDYVKGGGGSGDVTVEYTRNIYEGFKLKADKVTVFEDLCDYYRADIKDQYKQGRVPGMTVEPELPTELLEKARAFTDTAIISICRYSGEGWDRKSLFDPNNQALWDFEREMTELSNKIFKDGDFCLSANEAKLVNTVKANFDKVIIVLNVGGMIDTSWIKNDDKIQSVLLAYQGGMEGGLAAAELLLGEGNPSGKLVDTYAGSLDDYPSTYNFHESRDYVDYTDDIYVGYRYFETIPAARDKVVYPFGFGLSYTQFEIDPIAVACQDGQITVSANVTNIGKLSGKEVVQVYISKPQGKLGKASKELVAFQKTQELQPGQTQVVYLSFNINDFASYDDLGKLAKAAYVLEQGQYKLYLGNSVRDVEELEFIYEEDADRIVEQLTSKLVPTSLPKRMLSDGSFEDLPQLQPNDPNYSVIEKMDNMRLEAVAPASRSYDQYRLWGENDTPQLIQVAEGKLSMDDFVEALSNEELAELLGGAPNTGVANTFGFGGLRKYGIPAVMTADGPAGLRIAPECGVNTTAWPCSTLLASSWNEEIIEAVGQAAGLEVKENNIAVWLTPAINIHRSPLCGRNFEYYSEDPLLAGKLAAAMVRGIQSNHIGATLKHFAANNKETNRKNSDSRVSERALREIYLKPFEYVVKAENPWVVMTAYNMINGHRASENHDLIQGILRDEWGFEGMVTSDWWTCGEHYKETKAGNDVKMGNGYPDRLLQAGELGAITREEMENCVKRVLNLILKVD